MAGKQIRVSLLNPTDRKFWLCRWADPITGRPRYKSTATTLRREAERFRARLELELNAADYRDPVKVTWADFRRRYVEEIGPTKAPKTLAKTVSMFNAVEDLLGVKYLHALTAPVISAYATKLRGGGAATWTVRGHLSELRKVLRWAYRMELIPAVPAIDFPRAETHAKGRPITGEEFDRFLAAIPKAVPNPAWRSAWEYLARGLWCSGLRLKEIMRLHWTDAELILVDLTGRRPLLKIPAGLQKSRQAQLLPITPDFAALLKETPPDARRGWVFNPWTLPRGMGDGTHRPTAEHVGRILSKIGKAARISVAAGKNASAHDFRRSFATRWAPLLPSIVLRDLMRHKSVTTTELFYERTLAESAADTVWRAAGHTFGDTAPDAAPADAPHDAETP